MSTTTTNRSDITEQPYMTATLASVGPGSITDDQGWSIGADIPEGVELGATIEYFGRGFGFQVRGLAVGGHVIWYRTEAEQRAQNEADKVEQRAQNEADKVERDQQRRDQFEQTGRAKLDALYESLPNEFQDRIDRFRAGNPNFRWEYEAYEMGCCVDAVKIAEWCKTHRADPDQSWLAAVKAFRELPYEQQAEAGVSDGHSGNSFGVVCQLAYVWVLCPPDVVRLHGALASLTGCEAYGCTHEVIR